MSVRKAKPLAKAAWIEGHMDQLHLAATHGVEQGGK